MTSDAKDDKKDRPWLAEIKKAAPPNGELTPDQVQFLKDCRAAKLSFESIVPLWEKYMTSKTCRSSIRNRWQKIEREKL